MGKKPQKDGPPVALVRLVREEAQAATSHSWERYNTALRKALQLAIGAGFRFHSQDFHKLNDFRPGYWMGSDREWVYSMAVAEGNESAAKAWEEYKGREPIICDGVTPVLRHDSYAHTSGTRSQERIHVGCKFKFRGFEVQVTSFNTAGAAIAVARDDRRRFTITRQGAIQERADQKGRKQISDQLFSRVEKGEFTSKEVMAKLGCATKEEFEQLEFHVLCGRAAKV